MEAKWLVGKDFQRDFIENFHWDHPKNFIALQGRRAATLFKLAKEDEPEAFFETSVVALETTIERFEGKTRCKIDGRRTVKGEVSGKEFSDIVPDYFSYWENPEGHDICHLCGTDNGKNGEDRIGFDCFMCGGN